MSSESDGETFYDASEITPEKALSNLETDSEIAATTLSTCPSLKIESDFGQSYSPLRRSNLSVLSPSKPSRFFLSPPLTSKLASSLPTLHLEDPVAHSSTSLFLLEQRSLNEDINSILMPPPTILPAKYEDKKSNKNEILEETTSICSESLLETLSCVGDLEVKSNVRRRGRRDRHGQSRTSSEYEDDSAQASTPPPRDSPASSVEAFPSNQTSAPFRVVEVDATSIYSTTYSSEKGSRPSLKQGSERASESRMVSLEPPEKERAISACSEEAQIAGGAEVACALTFSPEPDVVASTKSNSLPREETKPTDRANLATEPVTVGALALPSPLREGVDDPHFLRPPPVAPPRRKRHRKPDSDSISTASFSSLHSSTAGIVGPEPDAVSRHMDLQEASRGSFLVCSEDSMRTKGADSTALKGHYGSLHHRIEESSSEAVELVSPRPENLAHHRASLPKEGSVNSPYTEEDRPKKTSIPASKSDSLVLTDEEILQRVSVLNLDTGERIPLSDAENCLPSALNPLSLHIMRLTNEYNSSKSGVEDYEDEESEEEEGGIVEAVVRKLPEVDPVALKKKTSQLKKLLGRRVESAVSKAKTFAHKNKHDKDVFEDVAPAQNTMQYVKIKTSHSYKGPHEFDNLMYVQELIGENTVPIWCMKFSSCGRLLATAGQDHVLRVWVLKQAFSYFLDIRTKWNADVKCSQSPSEESLVSQHSSQTSDEGAALDPNDDGAAPFMPKPFSVYAGHTADVLDLSWSKNYFMLTSSMDKTVRLWHINRKECLCIFKHVDFVTAIAFHPKDDRYFISGSLDGKLRLWSIPDKQVVMWNEVEGQPQLITAANFCQNGAFIVVGTYNGRCIFYKTEELKYFTQIHVKSSRGKNSQGRKITGIEPLPEKDMLLITSNDSRIRLYDLNVLNVACKYKGYSNFSSQIRAGFSHDGKYIVAGSENQCVYIWKTHHDYAKFSSARKDRNTYWEGVKAHSAAVTCAIFSPRPDHVFEFIEAQQEARKKENQDNKDNSVQSSPSKEASSNKGYVLVSADFNGCIKVFLKREKPKHSSLPASALV